MTTNEALKSLNQIKTFCSAAQQETLEFVIDILEKLDKSGIKDPLSADFSKINN